MYTQLYYPPATNIEVDNPLFVEENGLPFQGPIFHFLPRLFQGVYIQVTGDHFGASKKVFMIRLPQGSTRARGASERSPP